VLLRKFGQEVIRMTAGKRVHGTGSIPGGVNKSLTPEERAALLKDIYQMIAWSRDAVHLVKSLFEQNLAFYNEFGRFRANTLSLIRATAPWTCTTAACARAMPTATRSSTRWTTAATGNTCWRK